MVNKLSVLIPGSTRGKRLLFFIIGLFIVLPSLLGLLLNNRNSVVEVGAQTGPSLYFNPSTKNVQVGDTNQTYDIYMNTNGYQVTAAVIEISLNGLNVTTSIVPGTGLPVNLGSNVTSSTARITVGSQPTSPLNGTARVARITFNAGSTARTRTLSFTGNTEVAAVGYPGDVLGNTTSGSVVISGGPTSQWNTTSYSREN
jgi:hypothetical protein